jgi:hypothetical protein
MVYLDFFTLEDGTDRLSQNFSKELPPYTVVTQKSTYLKQNSYLQFLQHDRHTDKPKQKNDFIELLQY